MVDKNKRDWTFEDYVKHMRRLESKHHFFVWKGAFVELVTIIGQVQLALRHSRNTGESAKLARAIIDSWIELLDEKSPGIGSLLNMGFDPTCDVSSDPCSTEKGGEG